MPQSTDIILNGAGYMVEPGSYKRLQDGMAEGRTERIAITDFFGGQHRALQLERDKFHDSLAIGPALGGQGVVPWGHSDNLTGYDAPNLTQGLANRDVAVPFAYVRDKLWFGVGTGLYSGPMGTPTGAWAWGLATTFPNPIVDICIYGSIGLLISFGAAADILFYSTITGSTTALFAGERGYAIEAYAGHAAWSDARAASRPTIIKLVTGTGIDSRPLDHDPITLTTVGAELMVITKQALYSYRGRVKDVMVPNPAYTVGGTQPQTIAAREWSGEFDPFFQQGVYTERDDFRFFVGYGGRAVAWIAGGVHELVPSGDRAGWRSTGLSGKRCFGGTVAAGYVLVSIESWSGRNEVWAYDGNGWWRLASQPMPAFGEAGTWCNPITLGASMYGWNAFFFIEGSTNSVLGLKLVHALRTDGVLSHAYPADAQFVSPMIDAGERDKPKAWRKIGAVFASPERFGDLTSGDECGVMLDYSIDGGVSWWTAAAQLWPLGNTLANMNFELKTNLSGKVSNFIMLRIRWAGIVNWSPILTGIWAEYEVLHNPARRRKWNMKIHARDQEVDRDGVTFKQGVAAEATTNYVRDPRGTGPGGDRLFGATFAPDPAVQAPAPEVTYNALKVITNGSGPDEGMGWNVFDLPQDGAIHTATASVWVKDDGAPLYVAVQSWHNNYGIQIGASAFTSGTGTWELITLTYQTQALLITDAHALITVLANAAGPPRTWWVSHPQFELQPARTPYADGDMGAGHAWTGTPGDSASTRAFNDGFRTGRELIAELWQSWQNDTAETFRDIDYDSDPVERTVRIVGISEAVAQPADSNEWGDSVITLNLVEV